MASTTASNKSRFAASLLLILLLQTSPTSAFVGVPKSYLSTTTRGARSRLWSPSITTVLAASATTDVDDVGDCEAVNSDGSVAFASSSLAPRSIFDGPSVAIASFATTVMASLMILLAGPTIATAATPATTTMAVEDIFRTDMESSRLDVPTTLTNGPQFTSFLMGATESSPFDRLAEISSSSPPSSSSSEYDKEEGERMGLSAPTKDRPQIAFDGRRVDGQRLQDDSNREQPSATIARRFLNQNKNLMGEDKNVKKGPILRGLVYFPERPPQPSSSPSSPSAEEAIDYYNDVLILTAVPSSRPIDDTDGKPIVLAGAKLPLTAVRFPFSFEMYDANLLNKPGVRELWYGKEGVGGGAGGGVATTEDVIIQARVCPSDAKQSPCDDDEAVAKAEGIAKLIQNLPGLPEGTTVRASASLPLK